MTTTEARTSVGVDGEGVVIVEPDPEHYVRAAGDVIQAGIALTLFLVTLLAAVIFRAVVAGAQQDVYYLTRLVPGPISALLDAVVGLVTYLAPVVIAVELVVIRRVRVSLMVVGAGFLAAAGMWVVQQVLAVQVALPGVLGEFQRTTTAGVGWAPTNVVWIAVASAVVTVVNPWLPRNLRRAGIATVVIVLLTRIATGTYVPYQAAVAVVLGWFSGSAVLAALGSVNRRPRGTAVARELRRSGVPVRRLEMIGGGLGGSTHYRAETTDDRHRFVKVFDPNQRETDMLVQFYRWLRLRDPGERRPFSSLRRAVEHEALVTLAASQESVPTPALVAVSEVEPDAMLLALDFIDGEALAGSGPDGLDDLLLAEVWAIHAKLRDHRIAHRELRLDHLLRDRDGHPVITDFSSGQVAASIDLLRNDTVELLCSTALEVGPRRAVGAAAEALGTTALTEIAGRLQPLALSRRTRKQVSSCDDLLDDLRDEVKRVTGVEDVELEELARLRPRTLVTIVVMVLAAYVLLGQIASDTSETDIVALLATANWYWLVPLTLLMSLTWVGAAVSLIGSVPDRVPLMPTVRSQIAASFVDLLAPAALGGMALSTRFLQRRGIDPAVAVAGVGINALAGFVAHVAILGVFFLWAGGEEGGTQPITAPDGRTTALVVGGLVAAMAAVWTLAPSRRLVRERFLPFLGDAVSGLAELATRPGKLLALFGGSALITLGLYGALYCSVRAFGGDVSAAQLGVAYLLAATAVMVAPTPGGIGPLEVALQLALERLGLSRDVAFNSIMLFRFGTFWIPVLPGWLMFRSMQRREEI